jgi:transcriptional regulator with XRE-family HTH domain
MTETKGTPEWTFGDRMRKARRRSGMTVHEFAAAIGVSSSALGQYETDRATPRDIVALAQRVQQQTGIPAAWMLGLDDAEPPTSALAVIPAS